MRLTGRGSHRGIAGAALMGLTMGIAGASCLAAFIVSLLAFVAEKGDPALGLAVFLTLGLGFATPFAALATFSGLIQKLPKSGGWLVYSKKVMGTLMFGAAAYFLHTVVPDILFGPLVLIGLAAAGLYFGFFEKTPVTTKTFRAVRLFLGISFFVLAIRWSMPESAATSSDRIDWQTYSEEALEQARESGKPVVIDFFADWCVACVMLDRVSFSDPQVIDAAEGVVMLRADMTNANTPEASALAFRYKIFGFPTLVFLDSSGRERTDLRIVEFVPPIVVLDRLNRLKTPQLAP
jgi:thiol:disulfide interchange protein DsbD